MTERKNSPIEAPADRSVVLTRVFDAPRKLVFEAFTKKEHLEQWMAPRGFTIPSYGCNFRESGEWHCLMISPKGTRHSVSGVYRKIVPDELIVMTHTWEEDAGMPEHETTVTLRFEDAGASRTRLTVEHSIFESVASRDVHQAGWNECLDKLGEVVAKLQENSR